MARGGVWWDKLLADGRLAGFSCYFLAGGRGEMKLHKVYVHPDLQRRGHGGALIRPAAAVARARGCARLTLAVNKRNAATIAAYRKHGFAVVDAVTTDIREVGVHVTPGGCLTQTVHAIGQSRPAAARSRR